MEIVFYSSVCLSEFLIIILLETLICGQRSLKISLALEPVYIVCKLCLSLAFYSSICRVSCLHWFDGSFYDEQVTSVL
jgi:hypothetical protein